MCGIFGCFLSRPLAEKDIEICRHGRDALRHRGPDNVGEWFDISSGVYLGHTRLSILDLSVAGNQPMCFGKNVIALNGEIYNFHQIREDLTSRGLRFQSSGDTEVLLKAWAVWGDDALGRLDGMYAFVVYDGISAHLCVDPFGEKQLYWAHTKDGIYVSSELGPLASLLRAEPNLTGERLTAYLSLGYIPSPNTGFRNVFRLPAANILTVQKGEVKSRRKYWEIPFGRPGNSKVVPPTKNELDKIQESITESLRVRLFADVPLCIFLSSGVDSSLVAAIAKKELGVSLRCLTVSFPRGNVVNEAPMAAKVAEHLGLEFEELESDEDPSRAGAQRLLELFGQPNDAVSTVTCYQMAKAASGRFKVALTGMGGDEIFYGYSKHAFFYRYRRIYALPKGVRMSISRLIRILAPWSARLNHFGPLLGVNDWEFYLALKNYPGIEWLRGLPDFERWAHSEFKCLHQPEFGVPAYEASQVMQNSQLPSFDLGSMRASLELRTPYLSRTVIDTVSSFDPRLFMAFGQKQILRQLLLRYLPREFVEKRKLGFIFPHDQFLTSYDDDFPRIESLPDQLVKDVWQRRKESKGWSRIAVRLVLLAQFLGNHCDNS